MAPLMFVGHSAGGPQAKALAIKMADRCFGLVLYRGGVPGGDESVPPGVPVLMMLGQFDEFGGTMRDASGRETWEGGRDALVDFRARTIATWQASWSSLGQATSLGRTATPRTWRCSFARRQARIPDWPLDAKQPVQCKPVDPKSGWLSDLTIKTAGQFPGPLCTIHGRQGPCGLALRPGDG